MEKFIQLLREIVWCTTGLILIVMIMLWTEGVFAKSCMNLLFKYGLI